MASHFKTPDEKNAGSGANARANHGARARRSSTAGAHASGTHRSSSRSGSHAAGSSRPRITTRRGGDESYHAPASNPYAAGTPHNVDATFIPAVSRHAGASRSGGSRHRGRNAHFVETDPYDLTGRRSKDPRKRAGRIISVLLFIVGVGLIATAAGMWIYNQWQYHEQDQITQELATYADVSDNGTTAPSVDWEGLKAVNDDVVGWVQIPGTVVNFPVYQGETNETYLYTGADGSYAIGGLIFMDYANTAPGMVDGQTIIYGHHMRNGTMFKVIDDLTNQELFDGVSTVWYVTEDATYELEPLLIYTTFGDDEAARTFTFESSEELQDYLVSLLGKAEASRSDALDVIPGVSRVLTLCTCDYETDDSRALLVCVLKSEAGAAADAAADAADAGAATTEETN